MDIERIAEAEGMAVVEMDTNPETEPVEHGETLCKVEPDGDARAETVATNVGDASVERDALTEALTASDTVSVAVTETEPDCVAIDAEAECEVVPECVNHDSVGTTETLELGVYEPAPAIALITGVPVVTTLYVLTKDTVDNADSEALADAEPASVSEAIGVTLISGDALGDIVDVGDCDVCGEPLAEAVSAASEGVEISDALRVISTVGDGCADDDCTPVTLGNALRLCVAVAVEDALAEADNEIYALLDKYADGDGSADEEIVVVSIEDVLADTDSVADGELTVEDDFVAGLVGSDMRGVCETVTVTLIVTVVEEESKREAETLPLSIGDSVANTVADGIMVTDTEAETVTTVVRVIKGDSLAEMEREDAAVKDEQPDINAVALLETVQEGAPESLACPEKLLKPLAVIVTEPVPDDDGHEDPELDSVVMTVFVAKVDGLLDVDGEGEKELLPLTEDKLVTDTEDEALDTADKDSAADSVAEEEGVKSADAVAQKLASPETLLKPLAVIATEPVPDDDGHEDPELDCEVVNVDFGVAVVLADDDVTEVVLDDCVIVPDDEGQDVPELDPVEH